MSIISDKNYTLTGEQVTELAQKVNQAQSDATDAKTGLSSKVDKVSGKGLSTNDYTDEEKQKLSGIETGAEENAIESFSVNGTQQTPDSNKNVDISVPTLEDSLTSESITSALTAKQGKVLKDLIDSLVIKAAGAPTTSTVGTVGKLYEDTTNGKLYQCTEVNSGIYTWIEVGASSGQGIKVLTTADYNYPVDNPTKWVASNADSGYYYVAEEMQIGSDIRKPGTIILNSKTGDTSDTKAYITLSGKQLYLTSAGMNYKIIRQDDVKNDLTTSITTVPLSANQGKVLKDLIDSLIIKNAGAPTTSTVGTIGKLYEDTTNGKLYICTAIDTSITPNTYTWIEVGSGGAQVDTFTTDEWNALWA